MLNEIYWMLEGGSSRPKDFKFLLADRKKQLAEIQQ